MCQISLYIDEQLLRTQVMEGRFQSEELSKDLKILTPYC